MCWCSGGAFIARDDVSTSAVLPLNLVVGSRPEGTSKKVTLHRDASKQGTQRLQRKIGGCMGGKDVLGVLWGWFGLREWANRRLGERMVKKRWYLWWGLELHLQLPRSSPRMNDRGHPPQILPSPSSLPTRRTCRWHTVTHTRHTCSIKRVNVWERE